MKEHRTDRTERERTCSLGQKETKCTNHLPYGSLLSKTVRGEKKARSCVEFWQECRKLDLVAFQPGSLPITLGYPSQAAYGSARSQAITKEEQTTYFNTVQPDKYICVCVHKEKHSLHQHCCMLKYLLYHSTIFTCIHCLKYTETVQHLLKQIGSFKFFFAFYNKSFEFYHVIIYYCDKI